MFKYYRFITVIYIVFSLNNNNVLAQEDTYHTNLKNTLKTKYGISGGTWVFESDETNNATKTTGGGGTRTVVNITGQSFTKATRLAISTVPANPWNAGLSRNTVVALKKGDNVLLVFWARVISSTNGKGEGAFTFENNTTYDKDLNFEYRFGSEWKEYFIPFEITRDQPANGAKFSLQLGFQIQTVEIAGLALINYQQIYPLSSLPLQTHEVYEGYEQNAPWRAAAESRIEQIRKANLDISITDDKEKAITNAQVKIEMLQHDYPFGTAINPAFIAGNKNQNDTYQEKLLNLDGKGHGFSEVVFENGHKWTNWEGSWDETKANKAKAVQWLNQKGIAVRGHTLLWPGWKNLPTDMEANKANLSYLDNRVSNRITEMLTFPGLKGIIKDWDVLNEPTGNIDLANTYKGTSAKYKTGREIYIDAFKKVAQTDSTVKKYINEAHVSNLYVKEDFFRSIVQEVVDGGAKIDGVGFQAHFRYLMSMNDLYSYFDIYHKITGGKIKITEYDNKTLASDSLEASFFKDLLTLTFSHPASDGFIMWGFWDGAHYASRAPLFNNNWTLKPEGKPFIDLVFNKWWTPTTTQTSNNTGKVAVRGFKGRYKITITNGAEQIIDTVQLKSDLSLKYKLASPVIITSIDPKEPNSFKVFPNPIIDSQFVVERPNTLACTISLFNKSGQLVKTISTHEQKIQVDTHELASGIYVVEIQDNRSTERQKVLIK